MTIKEFETSDKMEHINSIMNSPKYLFFHFLSKNAIVGFVPKAFLEKDRIFKMCNYLMEL